MGVLPVHVWCSYWMLARVLYIWLCFYILVVYYGSHIHHNTHLSNHFLPHTTWSPPQLAFVTPTLIDSGLATPFSHTTMQLSLFLPLLPPVSIVYTCMYSSQYMYMYTFTCIMQHRVKIWVIPEGISLGHPACGLVARMAVLWCFYFLDWGALGISVYTCTCACSSCRTEEGPTCMYMVHIYMYIEHMYPHGRVKQSDRITWCHVTQCIYQTRWNVL